MKDWRDTPEGRAKYVERRAQAQMSANSDGFDRLLTKNDFAKDFFVYILPRRENRFGRDLDGEVVMCESIARCQIGHGPTARVRP